MTREDGLEVPVAEQHEGHRGGTDRDAEGHGEGDREGWASPLSHTFRIAVIPSHAISP